MGMLIAVLGWFVALLPRCLAAGTAAALGWCVYACMGARRKMMLRNLALCFPEKTLRERRKIARVSCCRMVEMGMFVLASPHFSDKRILKNFSVDESVVEAAKHAGAMVVAVPHFSLMESLTMIPLLHPPLRERSIGIFYRPFGNSAIERWVKTTRERFGCHLLSRKKGLTQALSFLRENGLVCVLPDQATGRRRGSSMLFFGRVATCSELVGSLAFGHAGTRTIIAWCERKGFWRGVVRVENVAPAGTPAEEVNFSVNAWLERRLASSASACADWLWMHDRWKGFSQLNLEHRHSYLEENLRFLGLKELPRKKKIFIRMPNWLGDVVMALPLVQAIRRSRPDAEITLLARAHFLPMLEMAGCGDRRIALPPKGRGYWRGLREIFREAYPEIYLLFTNSLRGDVEARISGAPTICGMVRRGHPRPLLTKAWRVPAEIDLTKNHQTLLWARWLQESCELRGEPDFTPLRLAEGTGGNASSSAGTLRVGLICGTENSPEKRWPVQRWRELISLLKIAFPQVEIRLFGTAKDAEITAQVAAVEEGGGATVIDRAGKTNLPDYMRELSACSVVCGNDTGGLHLANLLGVPVVGVFGPTNPVRTGPIFSAGKIILQPKGCPPTGGSPIENVSAETVFFALEKFLQK